MFLTVFIYIFGFSIFNLAKLIGAVLIETIEIPNKDDRIPLT